MAGVLTVIRASIIRPTLLRDHPLELYTIACNQEWPEVIQAAVMPSLSHDLSLSTSFAALKGISINDYERITKLGFPPESR